MEISKKDKEAIKCKDIKYQDQFIKISELIFNIHSQTILCSFLDFSGHVNKLSIRIAKTKEKYNIEILNEDWIDLSTDNSNIIKKLQKIYNNAKKY